MTSGVALKLFCGEFMSEELQNRVHDIAKQKIELDDQSSAILSNEEIDFLTISRGTLSKEDREVIRLTMDTH